MAGERASEHLGDVGRVWRAVRCQRGLGLREPAVQSDEPSTIEDASPEFAAFADEDAVFGVVHDLSRLAHKPSLVEGVTVHGKVEQSYCFPKDRLECMRLASPLSDLHAREALARPLGTSRPGRRR